jgi:ribosomal subunit interface protein
MSPTNIEVTTRGPVSAHAGEHARQKVRALERFVNTPILGARVVLIQERNPRSSQPARAEVEMDLQGHLVRARAAGPSIEAAMDEIEERLQRQLRRYLDRLITRHHSPAEALTARRSDRPWSSLRPPTPAHPAQKPEIVRRKSFAYGPMPTEEAADALEDLDHDFFLFHDVDTDADAVLYWRDDGLLAMIQPRRSAEIPVDRGPIREPSRLSSPIALEAAVAEMNAVGHRFLFFENAASGRGNVIYLRYDGHYGLIEPA